MFLPSLFLFDRIIIYNRILISSFFLIAKADEMKDSETKMTPFCKADDCVEAGITTGYCPRHYQQVRRHGMLTPEREHGKRDPNRVCRVKGCEEPEIAKGHCFRHYQQVRRHGRLTPERERLYKREGCSVPGCEATHSGRGYCKQHYMSKYYNLVVEARKKEAKALLLK